MSIEQQLAALQAALEVNTEALRSLSMELRKEKSNPVKAAPTLPPVALPPAAAAPALDLASIPRGATKVITLDEVKQKLISYAGRDGRPAAVSLLKKYGADRSDKLETNRYPEIYEELITLLQTPKTETSNG